MGRIRRVALTVLLAAAAASAGTAGLSSAQGADRHKAYEKQPMIEWKPCPEDSTVECGTLNVPVDWAHPDRDTVGIALARKKATDPSKRIGSLVANPGGPGVSGVRVALEAEYYFGSNIVERFDIVGFDPRGVARSSPILCSTEALDRPGFTLRPKNRTEFTALRAYNEQLADDCRSHTGPVIDHVDSVSVAHDMDAIRRALAEDKLNFFGMSYGTLMAQMYAEQYPDRIRTLAMDSSMDHSLDLQGFLVGEAMGVEDSFNEFVSWCDRSRQCALHGEDMTSIHEYLLSKAKAGELVDPGDGHKVNVEEYLGTTEGGFNGPAWVELAAWWKSLRDGEPTARAKPEPVVDRQTLMRTPQTRQVGRTELKEYPLPVFCQDWNVRTTLPGYRRLWAKLAEVAPRMGDSISGEWYIAGCQGWPGKVNNPQHRLRVERTVPPIMLYGSLHDPSTPYPWTVSTTRQLLGNHVDAGLLTYLGAGHTAYWRSDCTWAATEDYLFDRKIPEPGATCEGVEPAHAYVEQPGSRRAR